MDSHLRLLEEAWPQQPTGFRLLASGTVREKISIVISHQVCGNLLQESNTERITCFVLYSYLCDFPHA